MRSGGHNFNYFPKNKLTKLANFVQLKRGLVTLNHPTFNHATVNHRPAIDCAFSNMPIKTEWPCRTCIVNTTTEPYFPYKRRLIMKRGRGYCEQNKMQLKVGILICRHFSTVTIQHCGLSCKVSKKIFKCNIHRFYRKLLVHNLLPLTWM